MPPIIRFFWFLCAAVMLANIVLWRRRLSAIVAAGRATDDEARRFLRAAAAFLVGGPCLLGTIALVAGWSSPFCAGMLAFGTPAQALTSGITISAWLGFLWWIWLRGGAEILSRVGPAFGQRPDLRRTYSPAAVRLVATAIVLASALAAPLLWRTNPMPSRVSCPAPTVTG